MIIAQLSGGLGNQLFQYAAAKSLSLHKKKPLVLDISLFHRKELPELEVPREFELYNFQGINDKIISGTELNSFLLSSRKKYFEKLFPNYKRSVYTEPYFHFDDNFFNSQKNVLLKGQWQSEKYFYPYKKVLIEELKLNLELIANVKNIGETFLKSNSIAVHIRRSDYLRKQIILEWHGIMEKEYYLKAFSLLDEKLPSYTVYYFTDDPQWVQEQLMPVKRGIIVSGILSKTHYEDLYLMSQCRHNIIANSSFSWWGAWLNANPDKMVIAPKKWFNKGPKDTQDLIPEGWITI